MVATVCILIARKKHLANKGSSVKRHPWISAQLLRIYFIPYIFMCIYREVSYIGPGLFNSNASLDRDWAVAVDLALASRTYSTPAQHKR